MNSSRRQRMNLLDWLIILVFLQTGWYEQKKLALVDAPTLCNDHSRLDFLTSMPMAKLERMLPSPQLIITTEKPNKSVNAMQKNSREASWMLRILLHVMLFDV